MHWGVPMVAGMLLAGTLSLALVVAVRGLRARTA